jgi:hypothetical protein
MVIGCPGSGKSWVCDQLKDKFDYVHHDLFIGMAGDTYVREILNRSKSATKPLLIEAPFSISQIKDPLEQMGFKITPVFIQEQPQVITDRYRARERKDIPKGHLTRQETYKQRAQEWKAFQGTSSQVLEHLKGQLNKPATGTGAWGGIVGAVSDAPSGPDPATGQSSTGGQQ